MKTIQTMSYTGKMRKTLNLIPIIPSTIVLMQGNKDLCMKLPSKSVPWIEIIEINKIRNTRTMQMESNLVAVAYIFENICCDLDFLHMKVWSFVARINRVIAIICALRVCDTTIKTK
mmetsp:Transcript_20112/g.24383  ORF Transcript_20112/g.24383 Transcript_20112/m.24383 type:complete len:117 (+) Transcript_20112:1409-1759(+)